MKQSLGAKTIAYPHPVFVVGTYGGDGRPNLMTAAWGGICCSKPPCIAVSLRKATYTHGNITANRAFTVSIPGEAHAKAADYVGIYSGRDVDKFDVTGLTAVKSDLVNAPYVAEFPFVLECTLAHIFELGLHTQFVGEILDVKADPAVLGPNGLPDIEKVRPLLYSSGNQAYYGVGKRVGEAFSLGKVK